MSDWTIRRESKREGAPVVLTGERPPLNAGAGRRLDLTVVFTTRPGTAAALSLAGKLARDLDASLFLVVPQVVPYRIPLNCPLVSLSHIKRLMMSLIAASPARGLDVAIQICLCRDRKQCLSRFVTPNSVVLVGGRGSWWVRKERRLARLMRSQGHEVIFVDQEELGHA